MLPTTYVLLQLLVRGIFFACAWCVWEGAWLQRNVLFGVIPRLLDLLGVADWKEMASTYNYKIMAWVMPSNVANLVKKALVFIRSHRKNDCLQSMWGPAGGHLIFIFIYLLTHAVQYVRQCCTGDKAILLSRKDTGTEYIIICTKRSNKVTSWCVIRYCY